MSTSTVVAMAALSAGAPLTKIDLELAPLAADEVEIKITHCGVCASDHHLAAGHWGPWSVYPQVCGHEIVGTIAKAGPLVKGLAIGQRVGVGELWGKREKTLTIGYYILHLRPSTIKVYFYFIQSNPLLPSSPPPSPPHLHFRMGELINFLFKIFTVSNITLSLLTFSGKKRVKSATFAPQIVKLRVIKAFLHVLEETRVVSQRPFT